MAPRLNAAGRMENARDVIDLFTLPDPVRTREIAERLERLNRERQRVEEEILRAILRELEQRAGLDEQYTLVLAGEGWHRGVIGIVAQRVAERYHRPALVIGIEDGVGVGSGGPSRAFTCWMRSPRWATSSSALAGTRRRRDSPWRRSTSGTDAAL